MINIEKLNRTCFEKPEREEISWKFLKECLTRKKYLKINNGALNWQQEVPPLMNALTETITSRWQESARIEVLQKELALLKERFRDFERLSPILVPIESLAPEPYEVIKPFHVVVRFQDNQYIASFFDANLSASGDTRAEAVSNLKDIVIGTFEVFIMLDEKELGAGPKNQLKVMKEFIRKSS
jgi:hypothetical protein